VVGDSGAVFAAAFAADFDGDDDDGDRSKTIMRNKLNKYKYNLRR